MTPDEKKVFAWAATAIAAVLTAVALFLNTGELPPGIPPEPPPDTVIEPPPDDPRMVQGLHGFEGWGATALQACGPAEGDWDVHIVAVRPGDNVLAVMESLPTGPDLVAVVFPLGGAWPGTVDMRRIPRQSCTILAGHTAPEVPYIIGGMAISGRLSPGDTHDWWIAGLAVTAADVHGANSFQAICVSNVVVSGMSISFGNNDLMSVTHENCGGRVTLARSFVGPTAMGGRGGGIFPGGQGSPVECSMVSIHDMFYIEQEHRSPQSNCAPGPVEIRNIVAVNSTDAGRFVDGDMVTWGNVLSIGGPRTGCATNRALVWFDQGLAPTTPTRIYLEDITSLAAQGCDWTQVTSLWSGTHTVFHYSRLRVPVPYTGHGVDAPVGPQPDFPVVPASSVSLLDRAQLWGSQVGLSCAGDWVPRNNDLDRINLARAQSGDLKAEQLVVVDGREIPITWTGRREWEAQYGAITMPEGTPCPDANANLVPDAVEARWGHSEPGRLASDGRPSILHWFDGFARRGVFQ